MKVSFFSYKGGAGRTTSALNTAYYLINKVYHSNSARPFIIIDADTESAGISFLLLDDVKESIETWRSLQGLVANKSDNIFSSSDEDGFSGTIDCYPKLKEFFMPVGRKFGVENDAVLLLRANVIDDKLKAGFGDSQNETAKLDRLMEILYDRCRLHILFDTPAGTQPLSEYALKRSQVIVCHMRPSNQFQMGTMDCLKRLVGAISKRRIIVTPSVVPVNGVTIDGKHYPDHYKNESLVNFFKNMNTISEYNTLMQICSDMTEPTPEQYQCFGDKVSAEKRSVPIIGLPELVRFKWSECLLPVIKDLNEDEMLACERYYYLAGLINQK